MATLTKKQMEQREQSDACIDSAESRQKKGEGQLVEEGAWPLDDDDLDQAAGGVPPGVMRDTPIGPRGVV